MSAIQTAIAQTQAVSAPVIPEAFRARLDDFIAEGVLTVTMTDQGVTYAELRQQVARTAAAYELMTDAWPADLDDAPLGDFEQALHGWDLTLYLWNLKITDGGRPIEPDTRRYKEFKAYGGVELIEADCGGGRRCLPHDENISILMGLAAGAFDAGKTAIQTAIGGSGAGE